MVDNIIKEMKGKVFDNGIFMDDNYGEKHGGIPEIL